LGLSGAVQIWLEDRERRAAVILPETEFRPEGVSIYAGDAPIPYESLILLDEKRGVLTPFGFKNMRRAFGAVTGRGPYFWTKTMGSRAREGTFWKISCWTAWTPIEPSVSTTIAGWWGTICMWRRFTPQSKPT